MGSKINDRFMDTGLEHFRCSDSDIYLESRELRGEGRWLHAHGFIDSVTDANYEVWVDKYGATVIVEPNSFFKAMEAKGYKVTY